MNKGHYLFGIAIISMLLLINCKNNRSQDTDKDDCFSGLTQDEKALLNKIIGNMKKDKNDSAIIGDNSVSYFYFNYFDKIRAYKIQPIEPAYAQELVTNYDGKRQTIETLRPDRIRQERSGSTMKARDASSVWSSVDEFGPFFSQLIEFQIRNETKVGMKIVFGSYKWDPKDSDMTGSARTYGDSLSGRNTVYFVGTYDTVAKQNDYFVTRHKEIKDLSSSIPVVGYRVGSVINHGTLCPDSCSTP
jgi:hypothetical protein